MLRLYLTTCPRSCGHFLAVMLPASLVMQVRDFDVVDAAPYGVDFQYTGDDGTKTLHMFEKNSHVPNNKLLTVFRCACVPIRASTCLGLVPALVCGVHVNYCCYSLLISVQVCVCWCHLACACVCLSVSFPVCGVPVSILGVSAGIRCSSLLIFDWFPGFVDSRQFVPSGIRSTGATIKGCVQCLRGLSCRHSLESRSDAMCRRCVPCIFAAGIGML